MPFGTKKPPMVLARPGMTMAWGWGRGGGLVPETGEEMELARRSRRAGLVGPTDGARDRERERWVGEGEWRYWNGAEASWWGS